MLIWANSLELMHIVRRFVKKKIRRLYFQYHRSGSKNIFLMSLPRREVSEWGNHIGLFSATREKIQPRIPKREEKTFPVELFGADESDTGEGSLAKGVEKTKLRTMTRRKRRFTNVFTFVKKGGH